MLAQRLQTRAHYRGWAVSVFLSRWRNRLRYAAAAPFVYTNWWDIFRAKHRRVPTILALRNGIKYLIRPGTTDLAVINEATILGGYLRPGCISIPRHATVVDLGANIGDFAIRVAHLHPTALIYAVEPIASNCESIYENIRLNHSANVKVVQVAVGGSEGEVEIHQAGSHSSIAWGKGKTDSVRMTTLENLMYEQGIQTVDLLKMDVEGAEWDILPGSAPILPRIRQICLEYHNGKLDAGWLHGWLRDNGYEVRRTQGQWNGMLWAWRADIPASVKIPTC